MVVLNINSKKVIPKTFMVVPYFAAISSIIHTYTIIKDRKLREVYWQDK